MDWKITITAIGCITALEIVALMNGIDGVLLAGTIGAIAGIAGYTVPSPFAKKK